MAAAIAGAVGVLVGAIIAGAFSLINGNRQREADRQAQIRQGRMDFRLRQLSALYGPLYLERRRSTALRNLLPQNEPDGSRWRLVHHIAETKEDEERSLIVDLILESGDRVVELIREHGGLMEPRPTPQAFTKFVLHHTLLRLSWQSGHDQDPDNSYPFPGEVAATRDQDMSRCAEPDSIDTDLDCAIHVGMQRIQGDLEHLMELEG